MRTARPAGAALALALLVNRGAAQAGPSDYVITPTVEYGEREIDLKWGTERLRDGRSGNASSLGAGWGATAWWFTELYAKWHREPGERQGFDAWEWENRFQLTETGRYPVDLGLLLEIERRKDRAEGYELTYGPLLQAEWGSVQGNLNLLWQRHVRAAEATDTELHYQWQLKHRAMRELEWGAQGFGNLGRWDRWAPASRQEHKFGPALFGKFTVGATQALKYNLGLLFGINRASPRTTLRSQVEVEF